MPLFDFECECGEVVKDVWIKMADDKPENHPVCGCGKRLVKMASRVGASFRGRGFHCNDYRAPTRGF